VMDKRNPTQMAPEEIIREIAEQKKSLEQSARRLSELSRALHDRMRRSPDVEDAAVYVAFSNVWVRFSGMLNQALSRTTSGDRLLKLIPTESERAERERDLQRRKDQAQRRQERRESHPRSPIEDLMEMYGAEEVISAGGR